MTKEQIRTVLQERPFRPFKVRVAGDGEYEVPGLDHVHLNPSGRLLFIHVSENASVIIDVPLITSVHVKETV